MARNTRRSRWEPGTYQLDIFVRHPDGSVVEVNSKKGARLPKEMLQHAGAIVAMFLGMGVPTNLDRIERVMENDDGH